MSEASFLANLRDRLNKGPSTPHPGRFRSGRFDTTARAARLARFRAELTAVGGHVDIVSHPDQLRTRLQELRKQMDLHTVLRAEPPAGGPLAWQKWQQAVDDGGFRTISLAADRQTLATADAGVTLVDAAVADTGSLVLAAAPGRPRLVSLLPPVHIALLPTSRLVATRAELFAWLHPFIGAAPTAAGIRWPANVTFITGPSKTADIESDLTIGVHGPGHVHVFVFDDLADDDQ